MRKTLLPCMSLFVICLLCFSCAKQKDQQPPETSPEHLQISAHTSGEISIFSVIRIQFASEMVQPFETENTLKQSPISFTPAIEGNAVWWDNKTLEFHPDKPLPEGKDFKARISIPVPGDTTSSFRSYEFSFSTIKQAFELTWGDLKTPSAKHPEKQEYSGTLRTADAAPLNKIQKLLEARQQGARLQITWSQSDDRKTHNFIIKNIRRNHKPSSLRVEWDGRSIGVNERDGKTIEVPAFSKFAVTEIKAVQSFESYIEILFSDPPDKNQNLNGLIRVDNQTDLRFTVENNSVRVYSGSRWEAETRVYIETGIRNQQGASLNRPRTGVVIFETLLPEVRFAGKGVIVPTSRDLTIPIETVNLQAIMVKATRVFDQNITQFFQVNEYDGDRELHRVGRVVWKDIVQLDATPDKMNHWVRYGLDVRPLIENHKAGLYRLELTFLKPHILYDCEDSDEDQTEAVQQFLEAWTHEEEAESSYWNDWDENYNYNEYYRNRKNPCHPAYYRRYYDHDISVSRNILISDIGLIAKKGATDSVFVAATDIRTAEPLKDAELTLLDYQQQVIQKGRTNQDGMAFLTAERAPFVVMVRHKNQVSYLKLTRGSALSISHFDVGGARSQKGVKGFFYGERGVWRPGDDIYLTFILLDNTGQIPKNHPVKFTLQDPRGRVIKSRTVTGSVNGFYSFHTKTDQEALTGNWQAKAVIGGMTFEKTVKIETIMPNRLKMELDFGKEVTYIREGPLTATLKSEWLHGAPASLLKADVEVGFTPRKTAFPTHTDYTFDDPARIYSPESHRIFDGKLDITGRVTFESDIETRDVAPGMLTAHFKTRVFEPGGAFSVDRFSIPYHPYDQYVGIRAPEGDKARGMLLTDTTHTIRLALMDIEGNPVPSGKIDIELYKIKWRWWWEKGSESIADYIGRVSYRPIQKDTLNISNGEGVWNLRINYPEWGRFLIRARDMEGGHTTGIIKYIDWPGWAGRAQKEQTGGANVLAFTTDKTDYVVGEKALLNIPTGSSGRVLLTLESGSRILDARWLEARKGGIQYSIPIKPAMAPNVYAHVTLLQPHMTSGNDLPVRMYGVTPIRVTNPSTRLNPEVEAADVFEPMSNPTVTIREKEGRPMTYTLAVVDEGLLGLTRFSTPDPWNHFYQKEALGVQTWDFYDMVAGAYAGNLEKLLAIGGGEEGEEKGQQRANRFPPMVRFYGPFQLKKGKTAKHKIDIPQYIGAVRLMVVAGDHKAFGIADKSVQVKKPLMLLGTLPRVLSTGETVDLPVSVFALENHIRDVQVLVSLTGPVKIEGESEKHLRFETIGDQQVRFKIQAAKTSGIARINLTATSGKESISQMTELTVRIPSQRVTQVLDTLLYQDATWKREVILPGLQGTNHAVLELSRVPPINLEKRLKFLIHYPHGCIEQTTSSVFPQLYLSQLLELTHEQETEIQQNITAGIEQLVKFQTHDGGFGYWPGNADSQPWGTNYAGHFLIEAGHLGYYVPPDVMKKWRAYQRKTARHWTDTRARADLVQAYRLYTLALAGHPELGAMNRLKERKHLSVSARYRLAAAYELAGQTEAALFLIRGPRTVEDYQEFSYTYGSPVRDMSMILETLVLMEKLDETATIVREISESLGDKKWMSTQTTAYALLAMGKYMRLAPPSQTIDIEYAWKDGRLRRASSPKPVMQIPLALNQESRTILSVKNLSQGSLYPRMIMDGIPEPGHEAPAEVGLKLEVKYLSLDETPISIDEMKQGTDFLVRVSVTHTGHHGRYEEMALSHLFPSGWEIHNERMDPMIRRNQSSFDYQDIRDDRVYTYFDIDHKKSKTFIMTLTAAYCGKFYLPPVSCEAMYDATIHGLVKGRWIHVVPAE